MKKYIIEIDTDFDCKQSLENYVKEMFEDVWKDNKEVDFKVVEIKE